MSIPQRNATLILGVVALALVPLVVTATVAQGEGDVVDLADLADGETRTFGSPEHELTATREGDTVVLRFGDRDGEDGRLVIAQKELRCDLDDEDCTVKVWRSDDGAETFSIRMRGEDGDGARVERRVEILSGDGRAGQRILVDVMPRIEMLHLPDDADVREHVERLGIELESLGDRMHHIRIPAIPMTIFPDDGERVLQCPEGDTTMTVQEDESDDLFHCPKHGLALEPVEHGAPGGFHYRFRTDDGDEERGDGSGGSGGLERL